MAKIKAKEERTSTEGPTRRNKADEAEDRLRDYHALGLKVLARIQGGKLDADTRKKLTEQTGYSASIVRDALPFARDYSKSELEELCKLRTPEGMPLPWGHVRQLMRLPSREKRGTLQREAAEKGWSLEVLGAKLPKRPRVKKSSEGGRPFRGPKNLSDGLRRIVRHGDEWLRRCGSKAWSGFDWLGSKPGVAGRGVLKARIAEARQTLKKLAVAIKKLDVQLKELERKQAGKSVVDQE